jgi:ABC-type multidrug transport system fused ATPase/permease subunit
VPLPEREIIVKPLVARMPEGLDHRIGFNDGGGLSGGERQKLAIARALIRRPDILIFDEVTNHLDYESRLRMRDLLSRLRGKTTVLLVSHDPGLIKLCDMEIRLSTTGADA